MLFPFLSCVLGNATPLPAGKCVLFESDVIRINSIKNSDYFPGVILNVESKYIYVADVD